MRWQGIFDWPSHLRHCDTSKFELPLASPTVVPRYITIQFLLLQCIMIYIFYFFVLFLKWPPRYTGEYCNLDLKKNGRLHSVSVVIQNEAETCRLLQTLFKGLYCYMWVCASFCFYLTLGGCISGDPKKCKCRVWRRLDVQSRWIIFLGGAKMLQVTLKAKLQLWMEMSQAKALGLHILLFS